MYFEGVDQIFTPRRRPQAESYEYKKETFVLFFDFKEAYDKIKESELFGH